MNYKIVVGLEIHVAMKTKSKMFSPSPINYGAYPNTQTSPHDLAHPGTLPLINRQAVINAVLVSHALNMEIDRELWFDRKNYFYSDLPKGYQITQNFRPIGQKGYLKLKSGKKIQITRLHMEEDTAMQHHYSDCTLIDYNRAGVPLLEIVSEPEITSPDEAMEYVEKIRSIVTFTEVSNGKMEEGSLRVDVNISIHEPNSPFGTKVEIKNLNSISNVGKAIEYEANRQIKVLNEGRSIIQETRRYDDVSKSTISMREKTEAADYKYFVESNILPIRLSEEFISLAVNSCPELAEEKYHRYTTELNLSSYDASLLTTSKYLANYFDECLTLGAEAKITANYLITEVQGYLNKNNLTMEELPLKPALFTELMTFIQQGKINSTQAREVLTIMLDKLSPPSVIIEELGLKQISDENAILKIIQEVLKDNQQSVSDYLAGKDRAIGYLVGQVMKKTGGKVNPAVTNRLLIEEIKKNN